MKAIATVLIICFMGCLAACNGQGKEEALDSLIQKEKSTVESGKQMNLLDEQTKVFGQLFELAGAGEDNPAKGATTYLELLENLNVPKEEKEMLNEQFKIYDLSLDPNKKDSLKLMVNKMMTRAIEKSQSED